MNPITNIAKFIDDPITRLVLFVFPFWAFVSVCSGFLDGAEKNVVFVIADDMGTTLGCYGDTQARSPNLDALAKDGTLFRNAFATTASCSASRSVVMSGLHNHKNGQYGHTHHFHKFSSYLNVVGLALPRVMANAGYRTARSGKYHVAPEKVFHFEKTIPGPTRNLAKMVDNCREFITDKTDDRPFFLYLGTSDPHRGGGVDQNSELQFKPNRFGNKADRKSYPGVIEQFFEPEKLEVPKFLPDTPESKAELAQYYQSCSRIDFGLGRLVKVLKEAGLYDKTMIVFTSDHGMAFAGGKTTVFEPGLRVPFVVRNPYQETRNVKSDAMISHVDITPSLLDFAGGLDREANRPKNWTDPDQFWRKRDEDVAENRSGKMKFRNYQGKSWISILGDPKAVHHEAIFASHTFHEIQMYYPMRVIRDQKYKLIWNIAHKLDYPFATDLWAAASWQAQFQQGLDAPYGQKSVGQYIQRPRFELYDIENDPDEAYNLADKPEFAQVLQEYKRRLKQMQKDLEDPWIMKWSYE